MSIVTNKLSIYAQKYVMNSLGETNPIMVERTYRSIEKMIQTNKTFMIVKLALLN